LCKTGQELEYIPSFYIGQNSAAWLCLASCKGSWEIEYVAVGTGSPGKEELKNEHSLGSQQGLLINLDVPGPRCAWQRVGPQHIYGINTVE